MKMPAERLPALDAMRGVAALAVVLYHARAFFPGVPLARGGYLAVDLFFVLSGFVVAHAYEAKLRSNMSFGDFVRRRINRLGPLYYLGLAFGAVIALVLARPALEVAGSVAFGLAALPSPFQSGAAFPLNGALWSLTFELLINLVYALWLAKAGSRTLAAVAIASGLGLILTVFTLGNANVGWSWANLAGGLLRVGVSFPVGVLLYRHRARFPAILAAVPTWTILAASVVLLLAPAGPLRAIYDLGFILLASPVLVAAAASGVRTVPPALTYLGAISYALYAIHSPFVDNALELTKGLPPPLPVIGLALIAAMIGLATVAERVDRRVQAAIAQPRGARGLARP